MFFQLVIGSIVIIIMIAYLYRGASVKKTAGAHNSKVKTKSTCCCKLKPYLLLKGMGVRCGSYLLTVVEVLSLNYLTVSQQLDFKINQT